MEKTAYEYYLESTDKENFIVEKTIEWKLPEGDLVKILISQCKEIRKLNYIVNIRINVINYNF